VASKEPGDEGGFQGNECAQPQPEEEFADALASGLDVADPELKLRGSEFNEVPVTEADLIELDAVDGGSSLAEAAEVKSVRDAEVELEVALPDAGFDELQAIARSAADGAGEAPGEVVESGAGSVKDAEADHQK
jgi:hypothetical protein